MDPEQQQYLIDQLIPLLREKDFVDILNRLTQHENSDNRFLLKMELKRKCSPCRWVIDMRHELGESCLAHQFETVTHFMPAEAIALFESQCYLYRDSYTLGVYEALQAWQKRHQGRSHRLLHSPSNPVRQFDVNAISFASYYHRRDERMHFSSSVQIKFADGEKLFTKSADLSLSGIRVCVPSLPDDQSGSQVEVLFTGLGREHANPVLHQPVGYQLLGTESKEGKHWLRLVRNGDHPLFDAFLATFIKQNRHRYRVSVDYLLSTAIIKGYEQFYLPRMSGMPLFFGPMDNPGLEIALRTENNQHVLEYWRDTKDRDMLSGLFPTARMQSLLPAPGAMRETLIYCFTHSVHGQLYFFSATQEELQQRGLTSLFFQVGARRPSWRVYKFSLEQCALHEADLTGQQEGEDLPLQDTWLQNRLKQIGCVGLLQEIGLDSQRDEFHHDATSQYDANELQCFGHALDVSPFEIETLHHERAREEARYAHRTLVAIKHNGRTWLGWTRDISAHGMQIELEEAFEGEKDELVTVALPRLQELSKHMDLQRLPYRLSGINRTRTVLHLHIEGWPEQHTGHRFFSLLIESNLNKLTTVKEQRRYRGMAKALRNIYTHHVFNTPIYINKLNGVSKPASMGHALHQRSLSRLLRVGTEQEARANLYPLLQGDLLKTLLLDPLRTLTREDNPREEEVYIACLYSLVGPPRFTSRLASSFQSLAKKRDFIEQALRQGEFYSVLVGVSRTGRPDINFIANDLDHIAEFASHKAKQMEEELWSVVGVGELTDTSQATLFRLGITPPAG